MRVARGGVWIVTAVLTAAACAPDPGVEAERSRPLPTVPVTEPTSPSTTTTVAPSTTPPTPSTTDEPSATTSASPTSTISVAPDIDVDDERIERQFAGPFFVEYRGLPISSDDPVTGYNGFHSAVRLPDNRFVAIGFDAEGDGTQPERSAVWTSADGQSWTRTGLEISQREGQQSLTTLIVDGPLVHVLATDLGVADLGIAERSDGSVFTSSDGGASWQEEAIGTDLLLADGVMTPTGMLIAAVDVSGDSPKAVMLRRSASGWDRIPLPGAGGAVDAYSTAIRLIVSGTSLIVVGYRSTVVPATAGGVPLPDPMSDAETDVALWRSDDGGATWTNWHDEQFQGLPGQQLGLNAIDTGVGMFLATTDASSGQGTATIWRVNELGWEPLAVDLGRAQDELPPDILFVSSTDVSTPGGLVIVSRWYDIAEQRAIAYTTLLDTASLENSVLSLTSTLDFEQPEAAVTVDDAVWLFGRIERGRAESDLKIVEMRFPPPGS